MNKIQKILLLLENDKIKELKNEFDKIMSVKPSVLNIEDVQSIINDYVSTTIEGAKLDSEFYLGQLEFEILYPDTYGGSDVDGDYYDWKDNEYSWDRITISSEGENGKFQVEYYESGYSGFNKKPDKVLKLTSEGLGDILKKLKLFVRNAEVKSINLT